MPQYLVISIKKLIWDEWNEEHIAIHNVSKKEVEEVCHSEIIVLDGHSGRLVVIGMTASGERILAIVLDPEPEANVYYPVTARPADRKERKRYEEEKGGKKTNDKTS